MLYKEVVRILKRKKRMESCYTSFEKKEISSKANLVITKNFDF